MKRTKMVTEHLDGRVTGKIMPMSVALIRGILGGDWSVPWQITRIRMYRQDSGGQYSELVGWMRIDGYTRTWGIASGLGDG